MKTKVTMSIDSDLLREARVTRGSTNVFEDLGYPDAAERQAKRWASLFPGRYYIELQRAAFANTEALLSRSVALATRAGLPVVGVESAAKVLDSSLPVNALIERADRPEGAAR